MMSNKLVLLVGRSGSGKSTVANILEREYGRTQIQSYTTRKPRYPGEKGHIFVTDVEYTMTPFSEMIAYTRFDGNHYWATRKQAEENDIYVIDPFGVKYLRSHYFGGKNVVVVWLDCSSEVALRRMIRQGRSEEEALERVQHDFLIFFDPATVSPNCIIHTENHSPKEIAKEIEEVFRA